jgi:hypothetical protein
LGSSRQTLLSLLIEKASDLKVLKKNIWMNINIETMLSKYYSNSINHSPFAAVKGMRHE